MVVEGRDSSIYRKRVFCEALRVGDRVDEVFCVTRSQRRMGRNGPFITLEFTDRTGRVQGIAWNDVDDLAPLLVEGAFVQVVATVTDYRDEPQLSVESARRAPPVDASEFLPASPVPAADSVAAIRAMAATIVEPTLRQLVQDVLDDADLVARFSAAPAAKFHHHAYVGGLAEHTRSVMELCAAAARHYEELDRDLLLVAAFFHDIGKIEELAVEPGFPYTERGSLIGHIVLGHALLRDRIARIPGFSADRATDLEHLVLSHQGELEWGSPVKPQTLEGLVLHYVDNLDSKVASARSHLDRSSGERTPFVRSLGRSLYRRRGGDTESTLSLFDEGRVD